MNQCWHLNTSSFIETFCHCILTFARSLKVPSKSLAMPNATTFNHGIYSPISDATSVTEVCFDANDWFFLGKGITDLPRRPVIHLSTIKKSHINVASVNGGSVLTHDAIGSIRTPCIDFFLSKKVTGPQHFMSCSGQLFGKGAVPEYLRLSEERSCLVYFHVRISALCRVIWRFLTNFLTSHAFLPK